MSKTFQKRDWVVLGILVILGICLVSLFTYLPKQQGAYIEITMENGETMVYDLSMDQTISIPEDHPTNVIEIKDGKASMVYADCPDQICVRTGWVHTNHQTIVCLPHQITVTVISEEESPYDGIVQ